MVHYILYSTLKKLLFHTRITISNTAKTASGAMLVRAVLVRMMVPKVMPMVSMVTATAMAVVMIPMMMVMVTAMVMVATLSNG